MAGDIIRGDNDLRPSQSKPPTQQQWLCAKSVGCSLEPDGREEKPTFSPWDMSPRGSGAVCLFFTPTSDHK